MFGPYYGWMDSASRQKQKLPAVQVFVMNPGQFQAARSDIPGKTQLAA